MNKAAARDIISFNCVHRTPELSSTGVLNHYLAIIHDIFSDGLYIGA
jgi:hypothetical protein